MASAYSPCLQKDASLVQDYANRDPGCQRLRGHGVRIVPVYRKGVTLSQDYADTDPLVVKDYTYIIFLLDERYRDVKLESTDASFHPWPRKQVA